MRYYAMWENGDSEAAADKNRHQQKHAGMALQQNRNRRASASLFSGQIAALQNAVGESEKKKALKDSR